MPSAIPAAMASAISGPRLVKTSSFFSLSGMLVDRTGRRTCLDLVSLPRIRGSQSRPLGRLIQVKETFTRRRVRCGATRIDRQGPSHRLRAAQ